ncbi:type II toxin-antitoxin system RelE/ParE family toxin [Endozoicomonas lisbonensis]|uniref:Proteic killer suppression protein n=1 Tax=Endozoicomonas lisbonensis TaxID=3120522 RepID=A0ABV2SP78_9GAMM
MIKTFKHKGLRVFFETGSTKGIMVSHKDKLRRILTHLDAASRVEDMNFPAYRLHQLKGNLEGQWSVTVNGNWRVFFKFKDGHAYIVNYNDYH